MYAMYYPLKQTLRMNQSPVVRTASSAVDLPQRVGHASLVPQEGGEVDGLAGHVFGPGTHFAPVPLAALVGQEAHVSMAGCVEFAMRLKREK